jgi:hypothetical protein
MHRTRGRLLALLAFGAGTAAGLLAVLSALHASVDGVETAQATPAARTESFGPAQVVVRRLPSGITCYRVIEASGSSHACRKHVHANEIGYTVAPRAIAGVAGENVRAVIVKFTLHGTKWATLQNGVFYADVPIPYRVRGVIKVLRDGSRKRFAVTPTTA